MGPLQIGLFLGYIWSNFISSKVQQKALRSLFLFLLKCESGAGIRAMLEMIDTPPRKIVFLGPGCSVATAPVAEAAPYWQAVQVS